MKSVSDRFFAATDRRKEPPRIETKGLGLFYGEAQALADVKVRAEAGRVTAIVGPSGCGKSSFLTCINRLIDTVPRARTTGEVLIDSLNVRSPGADPVLLRRRIGMVFQKPNPFPMSIRENVQLALREHGVHRRRVLEETMERALSEVGLFDEVKDRLGKSAHELSGGQQQRLCFARALALEPEALLLDEPSSALDPVATEVIEALIDRLRGRYTMLLVTHNLAQAKRLADDVAVFWCIEGQGRVVEQGPARTIFDSPAHPITRSYVSGRDG